MGQRERRAPLHALGLPVERVDQLLHLDVGGVAEAHEMGLEVVARSTALLGPVDAAVEVGGRLQDVEGVASRRGHGGLVQGRHADEERRVGHPHAVLQDRLEGAVPLPAEVDVVVLGARRELPLHAHVPHQGRRRVGALSSRSRRLEAGQERAIGDGQVGVGHHGLGAHDLAALEADASHRSAGAVLQEDAIDADVVVELGPSVLGRLGQRHRQGVHASHRDEHAVDAVHVGDHGVDGQRLVRRQAGVHGLEAEDPVQPLVVEVAADDLGQATEPA